MKIAAVVILYQPDDTVIDNIKSYYNYVDKIFAIDNSEKDSSLRESLRDLSKIEFFQDFENKGIANRLNFACNLAIDQHFEWIMTMDQDSNFHEDVISSYYRCFHQYPHKEKVAAFGTKHSRKVKTKLLECEPLQVEDLMTSGTLLNLSLFGEIKGFDEALFIDYVDNDYCIRSVMAGYSVIKFNNISILHQLGNPVYRSSIKTLFLVKKRKFIHSPLRCYYMYRNMLYLEQKYKETNRKFAKETRMHIKARIKVCMLYGGEFFKILKYIKLAKADFKNNRMGKIQHNLY
jgi:rhamnosyltransferase